MRFVEGQAWSSWKGMVDGIEGETGWSWFHMCTSMIAPTVYKNFQIPFGPRGFRRMYLYQRSMVAERHSGINVFAYSLA